MNRFLVKRSGLIDGMWVIVDRDTERLVVLKGSRHFRSVGDAFAVAERFAIQPDEGEHDS